MSAVGQGLFSCHQRKLPDEPEFTLLGRDPHFAMLVRKWADLREMAVACGDRPHEDLEQCRDARAIADAGETWRRDNLYTWRQP